MSENYTTSTAFLEALQEAGVSYIFANLGSDHPAMIEALALAKKQNKKFPEVITCPHEMVALTAASSYAQMTGEPQAVVVHVECGTQNLGGAIHNAAKGRIPVLIFAGASPYTQEGELLGSRNEFIHWLQDVHDQRGIVRGYTKYDNEIRTGSNVKQLVHRSLQIAKSNPKGPVYLVGPREVMEETTQKVNIDTNQWEPLASAALPAEDVKNIVADLKKAKKPLVITSYLGREREAVEELVKLCESLSIPVIESVPSYMNFPGDHSLHCGYQWWNSPDKIELLTDADVILVLDSDVPWIPMKHKPNGDCIIYHIDVDPLKQQMPLWYIKSKRSFYADCKIALRQINEMLDNESLDKTEIVTRRGKISNIHQQQVEEEQELEQINSEYITPEYLTSCIREIVDENTIILNEGISNYPIIYKHIRSNKPGSIISSGAGSLGWHGGAAIGVKLAYKDKTVISLTGDGSYMFSVPSTVHWMARKYNTPFLTVIYNNRGWKSPKLSTLGVHPDGVANEMSEFHVDFGPVTDYAKVAEAAGGAYAQTVKDPKDVKGALQNALQAIKEGRAAVLDVYLPAIHPEKDVDFGDKAVTLMK
ncbi:thiamine pyrophosphate-requiring protein [Bacillus sp. Marseille-P3661]|uniref:thiamine pyrophosphate-requiring protein n=1 Tax=Bacillus sp. Marseille-P3661 TaxID=1936234 RepID=UPI000C85C782|nr:thiamine pyrophosphate-requiring protein [Bacillus sp. Marseille-P3661]